MNQTFAEISQKHPEFEALHARQEKARDDFYSALCVAYKPTPRISREEAWAAPDVVRAHQEYDATVVALTTLLGEDAYCNFADIDLFSEFSDFYKSVEGFRPRHHVTRQSCKDYMAQERNLNAQEATA